MQPETAQGPTLDYNTMAIWTNAPTGYEYVFCLHFILADWSIDSPSQSSWADWGSYVSTVDAFMQSLEVDPSGS